MDVIVGDRLILIRLAQERGLGQPIRLPYPLVVPDVANADELASQGICDGPTLVQMRIRLRHLDPDGVELAGTYQARYPGLSTTEIFALVLAEAEARRSILLTGEPLLARIAEAHALEVRGILWILDEICRHATTESAAAETALLRGG